MSSETQANGAAVTAAAAAQQLSSDDFYALIKQAGVADNDLRNKAEDQLKSMPYEVLFNSARALLHAQNACSEPIKDSDKRFTSSLIKNCFPKLPELSTDAKQHIHQDLCTLYTQCAQIPMQHESNRYIVANIVLEPIIDSFTQHPESSQMVKQFAEAMLPLVKGTDKAQCLIAVGALAKLADEFQQHQVDEQAVIAHIEQFSLSAMQSISALDGQLDADTAYYSLELVKHLGVYVVYSEAPKHLEQLFSLLVQFSCFLLSQQAILNDWGKILDTMLDVSNYRPRFFADHVAMITDAVINVLLVQHSIPGIKSAAMRLHSNLFSFLKKRFLALPEEKTSHFVLLLADLMADEDALDDFEEDDDNDDDGAYNDAQMNNLSRQAEIVFDKMCCEEPKLMFGFVQQIVSKFFAAEATIAQNVAGINIISCAGEGCRKDYEENILGICSTYILPKVRGADLHPKVRYCALTAIGVICSEFKSIIVEKLHTEITDAYVVALMNRSNDVVQRHAFLALNNFFEVCPEHLLSKTVKRLVPCYVSGLAQNSKPLIHQIMGSICQLSDRDIPMDELYVAIREPAQQIMQAAFKLPSTFELGSLCLMTICSIGVHTDKQTFGQDAVSMLNFIFSTMSSSMLSGSDQYDLQNLVQSLLMIVCALRKDYEPFVDKTLELCNAMLVKMIEFSERQYTNFVEMSRTYDLSSMTNLDPDKHKINTTLTNTCCSICDLLAELCTTMGEPFYARVSQFAPLLKQMLKIPTIIYPAFQVLGAIVPIAGADIPAVWKSYSELIGDVFQFSKHHSYYYNQVLSQLMSTVEKIGKSYATMEFLTGIGEIVKHGLDAQLEESAKKFKKNEFKANEDVLYDEELEDSLDIDDEEDSYLEGVNCFVETMFKLLGVDFIPMFESLLPVLVKFSEIPAPSEADLFQVFSIMASAVEYGPAEVASYFHPQIEQLISKFGQKQDWTTVHRVIFYTINLIAQKKVPGGVFDAFFKTQIPFLKSYAENSASTMDEATQNAVDNSISALISIMRHSPQVYGAEFDSFAQYALSHLPFRCDVEETQNAYEFCAELVESSGYKQLREETTLALIKAIVLGYEVVEMHLAKSKLVKRLVECLKVLQSQSSAFGRLQTTLSNEQKNMLELLITSST